MSGNRTLKCRYCPERFGNNIRRSRHARTVHPDERPPAPVWPVKVRKPSLKRETDAWPGRP